VNAIKTHIHYLFPFLLVVLLGQVSTGLAQTSSTVSAVPAEVTSTEVAPDSEMSLDKINQETKELLNSLKTYSAGQRDEALAKTRQAMDGMGTRIEALQDKLDKNWDKMDQSAREKARNSLTALQRQRAQVAEWYGSLKSSSAGAWGHIRSGLSSAYSDLHEAWEKAEKEYRSENK